MTHFSGENQKENIIENQQKGNTNNTASTNQQPSQQSTPFPPQEQPQQPGVESLMTPRPIFDNPNYKGSGKLLDKVAIITGGDSGQGRAVSVAFAKEGADIVIVYLNEHNDAEETKQVVEKLGRKCVLMPGDIGEETFCQQVVDDTIKEFGKLDILVNNAAEQHVKSGLEKITTEQMMRTFETNFFSIFYLCRAALVHMKPGSTIINAGSLTAYEGNKQLIDYSATKGAIVSFTRSLSKSLHTKGIRVNGVCPGNMWTPLIPASFPAHQVANWGMKAPMKRAGQPYEVAPAYVFLASEDSSYMSGQFVHVNGGVVING